MINNFSKMEEINIKSLKPEGWLYDFLEMQAKGLTGNLEVAGYPYDCCSWDNPNSGNEREGFPRWWPYEQTGYWIDGMERCAQLLDDKNLLAKADKSLNYVLENTDKDGFMGPEFMKTTELVNIRWSLAVFFRAYMAKYSATKDEKILEKLTKHFLGDDYPYDIERDIQNIEIMLWIYLETGNEKLLERAEKAYASYNEKAVNDCCVKTMKTTKKPYAHGVSYNEFFKLGAILFICTGKTDYLKPSIKAYEKLDRYFMLADGLHCSDEELHGFDHMHGHETCNISDYTWSLAYLLMATGDAKWADRIERCVFNAGIGSVTEDFKGLQYFSCPNQTVATKFSNHCMYCKGNTAMSYRPMPYTACCTGNVNRFFPNYCLHMWMKKGDDLYATLYGANTFTYNGVTVKEETDYPFDDSISFTFTMDAPKKLNLYLRIPEWCKNAKISLNGKRVNFKNEKGFALISREFSNNDKIVLELPSEITVKDYRGQGNFVEKGPLVYAFGMYGNREIDTEDQNSTSDFPAYNIYPDKEWNYSICTAAKDIKRYEFNTRKINGNPWDIRNVPYSINVPAQKVNGWKLKNAHKINAVGAGNTRFKRTGDFTFTPRIPKQEFINKHGFGEKENITLVPVASAKLRITVFPKDTDK